MLQLQFRLWQDQVVSRRSVAERKTVLEDAWIGDAVLSLFARKRILRGDGLLDQAKFTRMTSNQFLAVVGEPSEVEAEIGRVYERDGLEAAFQWMEARLMPVFEKQEEKRRKRGG
jgi:dsRNA-specific ribonuclease